VSDFTRERTGDALRLLPRPWSAFTIATSEGQETFMAGDQAKQGLRARLAERRADRRQRRAWRRERRKGSIDSGAVGAPASNSFHHGQGGPAGQQGAGAGGVPNG
jgi:hypothetical protein